MTRVMRLAVIVLFAILLPSSGFAQRVWLTPDGSASGYAAGTVVMCLNGSNQAVPCSAATPMPVTGVASATAVANCTIGLTTGGTAQNILSADATRREVQLFNMDVETENFYANETGTATVPVALTSGASWPVTPGGIAVLTGIQAQQAISVIAATTGHRIGCRRLN